MARGGERGVKTTSSEKARREAPEGDGQTKYLMTARSKVGKVRQKVVGLLSASLSAEALSPADPIHTNSHYINNKKTTRLGDRMWSFPRLGQCSIIPRSGSRKGRQ